MQRVPLQCRGTALTEIGTFRITNNITLQMLYGALRLFQPTTLPVTNEQPLLAHTSCIAAALGAVITSIVHRYEKMRKTKQFPIPRSVSTTALKSHCCMHPEGMDSPLQASSLQLQLVVATSKPTNRPILGSRHCSNDLLGLGGGRVCC